MSKSKAKKPMAIKKKPGRPKAGEEYPVRHKPARECSWCGEVENFKANRSALVIGIVKIEWLRCLAPKCLKVTRFETRIK